MDDDNPDPDLAAVLLAYIITTVLCVAVWSVVLFTILRK